MNSIYYFKFSFLPQNDFKSLFFIPKSSYETVPTFAVRETDVSRHNGGTSGAPLKPLRVDSALRALSTLRGLRGAPEVPPLCRETQSLGQQMLNTPFGINGLNQSYLDTKLSYLHIRLF